MSHHLVLAIPSPDLVVNLFASAGQVLGLLAATAGGVALRSRRRGAGDASPWPFRVAALLLVATLASFLLYHFRVVDRERARLAANLSRPSVEAGERVGDTSLWTLGFSDQVEHPLGLSTDALSALLESGAPLELVDVRESEEVEMGRIAGSWHRRYPDLLAEPGPLLDEGVERVLICYSGNRSSELAALFHERGVECRFVIGGYEKYIAEGRPLDLAEGRDPSELRALPRFPNDRVLLTTAEVHEARRDRAAVFVDVRYPTEFERGHLPGAFNLPMRRLESQELEAALADVPPGPIVLPCYDKRSSFYASLVALRLARAGREVLGRYTLPHEYFEAKGPRAHVAAWEAANVGRTPLGVLREAFIDVLAWLQGRLGSLAAAIVLLVVALRLLILPLSLKSDVDSWRGRKAAQEVAALRAERAGDPRRAMRAVRQRMRGERLTPGRNLVASLLQVVVFLVLFAAVDRSAAGSTETLGWFTLGTPDATGLLPALVAACTAALVLRGGRSSARRIVAAAAAAALLATLTWQLRSAVGLYLVVSLVWVLAQSALARRIVVGRAPRRRSRRGGPVVPLAAAAGRDDVGGKGAQLGELVAGGFPVPAGFVVPSAAFTDDELAPSDARAVRAAARRLGAERFAVRSSGLSEDGAEQSYAGVFDTRLDVTPDELIDAVHEIRRSLGSARLAVYEGENTDADASVPRHEGAVVVQAMVPSEYSGVLFTQHPGHTAQALVELVEGLGEALVSGRATPHRFAFGRLTGRVLDSEGGALPPVDLAPLLELGRRVEARRGRPQDVEWAYANGSFQLLQTRDITALAHEVDAGGLEPDRQRLVAQLERWSSSGSVETDEELFAENELAELLPEPSPYSAALMTRLWAPGGAVDLACDDLGVPYDPSESGPPLFVHAFGQLLVDRREERARRGAPGALAGWRVARLAGSIEAEVRDEFVPSSEKRAILARATDPSRLHLDDLTQLHDERLDEFVTQTYRTAERVNVAAEMFVQSAVARLQRRGVDAAAALGGGLGTVPATALALAGRGERDAFLRLFGHRAPHDFELSEPRYHESPWVVDALARNDVHRKASGAPDLSGLSRMDRAVLERARTFQCLKEEAKHAAMRALDELRALALELGRRAGLDEHQTFHLSPVELTRAARVGPAGSWSKLAQGRLEHAELARSLALPTRWTPSALEGALAAPVEVVPGDGSLRGLRVSGSREVVGRARVLHSDADIGSLQPGEVLVARFTDPRWTPGFTRAAGVVTEVGGWLSHAAILARELELPAVVAVEGATRRLKTGDLIRLDSAGAVEVLASAVTPPIAQERA